jgi:SAM-dependent methyltransferase
MARRLDVSDLYDDAYTEYIQAYRRQVELVASEILLDHFVNADGTLKPFDDRPEAAPSRTAYNFRRKLTEYFTDKGELLPGPDGTRVVAESVRQRVADREAIGAVTQPVLGQLYEYLGLIRAVSGPVLAGKDALATIDAQKGMKYQLKFWEYLIVEMKAKRVCNVLMARALVEKLAEGPGITVFEGGAGLGAVLREAMADPRFAEVSKNLARFDFTDISPLILDVGKQWLKPRLAPEVFQRLHFHKVDLDALPAGGPMARPASVDLILLEHVLYDLRDLHASLKTFRAMLKPGGQLAFTMSFRDRPSVFFPNEIFQSMLHTYNKAKLDPPRREYVGYLTLREWELSLRDAGFTDWDVYPAADDHGKWPFGGIIAYR